MFKCVFKSINVGSLWYKNDCYILATQARMVFYLPDTKFGPNWQVVQTFEHKHHYNVRVYNIILLPIKMISVVKRTSAEVERAE